MRPFTALRALLLTAAILLGLPLLASAAPIYYFDSGTVTITANVGATVITPAPPDNTIDLDGSLIEFDSATPSLVDLEFTATDEGPISITLPAPFPDYDQITIDTLTVEQPIGGFTINAGSGTGPYSVTVGPVNVSGTATLSDSGAVLPDSSGAFSFQSTFLTGTIDLSGPTDGTLEFLAVQLGSIDLDAGGPLPAITLKGDFTFVGVVPEPGTALMLGTGLGMLSLWRRRRR